MVRPQSATARGLFQVLERSLQRLGIQELSARECTRLVGVGTDGAAANIAASGLKGLVEGQLQWVFWMWCMAHRLELAIKDALKGTFFTDIDEMLLRLYYLYEKSPKRCRELEDIITDLKDCMCFDDAGVKPVRARGSRWVTHKLNAMKQVISKSDEIDIIGALTGVLQTLQEMNKLGLKPIEEWPTYAVTMRKIVQEGEDDDCKTYQCQELEHFSAAVSFFSSKYEGYASAVAECIKSRLSWSDMDLMRDIIFMLSTHGWRKPWKRKMTWQPLIVLCKDSPSYCRVPVLKPKRWFENSKK